MNALSVIRTMPTTKREQAIFVEKAKNEILSGEVDITEIACFLDTVAKTFELIQKDSEVRAAIEGELSKYPEKTVMYGSHSITKGVRTSYSYDHDDVWRNTKEALKQREEMMQLAAKANGTIYDDEGVEIPPAASKQSEYLSFKLL